MPANGPGVASSARDVDAAWLALSGASSLEDLADPWLTLQVRMAGADGGAVYLVKTDVNAEQARMIATKGNVSAPDLDPIATQVFETGRPVLSRPTDSPQSAFVGHPVMDETAVVSVAVVLLISDANPQRVRNAARALAWGSVWLRECLAREGRRQSDQKKKIMRGAHEIFAAMIEDHQAHRAALGTVTRLAQEVGAERVSLGFRQRGQVRLTAMSHSAEFRKQMSLSRRVAAAMDEAIDQRAALSYPPPDNEINATRAQKELAGDDGRCAVLTIPFMIGAIHQGAVTLQRNEDHPFTADEVAFLDFTVSLVGPVLWDKKQNDKWLILKVTDTIGRQLIRLFGPGYALRKLIFATLIGLVVLFSMWSRPYRIGSDAVVEGAVQRSIVAPFDGFVRDAPVRAGDLVAKGDLIAALDDRDLVLQRLHWMTERRQKELEFGRAIGKQDRAESKISRVQIAQAEAQIGLIDAHLDRAKLIAPFDGIVVSGDQSQNIGGSILRGTVMFEVAPVDDYRIVMSVDESRISEVKVGQSGDLVVTALPDTEFPFKVNKITPVAQAIEGNNTFRIEAAFVGPTTALRPGMRGVAKVDVDDRLVVSIWTRELTDWVKLTLWSWFG